MLMRGLGCERGDVEGTIEEEKTDRTEEVRKNRRRQKEQKKTGRTEEDRKNIRRNRGRRVRS